MPFIVLAAGYLGSCLEDVDEDDVGMMGNHTRSSSRLVGGGGGGGHHQEDDVNLQIPFESKPSYDVLCEAITNVFSYELNKRMTMMKVGKDGGSLSTSSSCGAAFVIDRIHIYNDQLVQWVDFIDVYEQLHKYDQLYVFGYCRNSGQVVTSDGCSGERKAEAHRRRRRQEEEQQQQMGRRRRIPDPVVSGYFRDASNPLLIKSPGSVQGRYSGGGGGDTGVGKRFHGDPLFGREDDDDEVGATKGSTSTRTNKKKTREPYVRIVRTTTTTGGGASSLWLDDDDEEEGCSPPFPMRQGLLSPTRDGNTNSTGRHHSRSPSPPHVQTARPHHCGILHTDPPPPATTSSSSFALLSKYEDLFDAIIASSSSASGRGRRRRRGGSQRRPIITNTTTNNTHTSIHHTPRREEEEEEVISLRDFSHFVFSVCGMKLRRASVEQMFIAHAKREEEEHNHDVIVGYHHHHRTMSGHHDDNCSASSLATIPTAAVGHENRRQLGGSPGRRSTRGGNDGEDDETGGEKCFTFDTFALFCERHPFFVESCRGHLHRYSEEEKAESRARQCVQHVNDLQDKRQELEDALRQVEDEIQSGNEKRRKVAGELALLRREHDEVTEEETDVLEKEIVFAVQRKEMRYAEKNLSESVVKQQKNSSRYHHQQRFVYGQGYTTTTPSNNNNNNNNNDDEGNMTTPSKQHPHGHPQSDGGDRTAPRGGSDQRSRYQPVTVKTYTPYRY